MADEKTFTKDELDAAVTAAVDKATGDVDGLKAKVEALIGDNKKLKGDLRKVQDVTPETHQAEVERADKAEAALVEAGKAVKALTGERDKAVKALETETAAARSYALDAEIAAGIAEGGIIPALSGAYRALLKEQKPEVELIDGKYISKIAGKPVREFITEDLSGDNGKHFKAAPANSGGGAGGGSGSGGATKTVTRAAFDGMSQPERSKFSLDGGKVVDVAA